MSASSKRLSAILVGLALIAAMGGASYTVSSGDTLSEIATANGVSTSALAEANDIANIDRIRVGQVLTIPGQTPSSAAATYQVKEGDRLADIAHANDLTISELAAANGIGNINLIRIGQKLTIPGAVPAAAASTPTPTQSQSYLVASGDALSLIALSFGVSTAELADANNIDDPDQIRIGQKLVVPASEAPKADVAATPAAPAPVPAPAQPVPAPAPQVVTYVVASGDALSLIARDHGVSTEALAEANDIDDAATILVGQKLTIPTAVPAAVAPPAAPEASAPAANTPASSTPPPIPLPDPDDPQVVTTETYYQVKAGDTLSKIASSFINMTPEDIAYANGIEGEANLAAGTTLLVPVLERNLRGVVSPDAFKANNETFHTVADGETMTSIAQTYGVDVNEMAEINGIGDIRYVAVGHVLEIPSNRWVCPLPDAIFINDWGFPRTGGRTHEGNDLFVPIGTPVLAPVAGTVTNKQGPIGGLQFNLVGDDGVLYIGSHLSEFGPEGRVSSGTVIGYVGDSGNAAGAKPHLHFEMHPGGTDNPTNPYPTLVRACR